MANADKQYLVNIMANSVSAKTSSSESASALRITSGGVLVGGVPGIVSFMLSTGQLVQFADRVGDALWSDQVWVR